MDRYIGLDVHKASCTLVVLDAKGKKLTERVVDTHGQTLIDTFKGIAGTKHLCFEEGTHSTWLFEILQPHVDRIAVVHITQRRVSKSDSKDAHELAERMRTDSLGATVFKDPTAFATLRQLVKTHQAVVRDTTRCMNRIHALFRSRAIPLSNVNWKRPSSRDALFAELPVSSRSAAETLFAAYDAMSEVRELAEADVTAELKTFPLAKRITTCPGFGPIRTAQLLATVITPERFRTVRQFWSYCGLGIVTHSSADWVRDKKGGWARTNTEQTRGLSKQKNSTLKAVFKGAATTVILNNTPTPLKAYYEHLCKAGTKPNLAKVSLARKIAAIVLAMWKQGKEYTPNLPEPTPLRKVPPEGDAQDERLVECGCGTPEPKYRFGREHPFSVWSSLGQTPLRGYALPEFRRKPWHNDAPREGWNPLSSEVTHASPVSTKLARHESRLVLHTKARQRPDTANPSKVLLTEALGRGWNQTPKRRKRRRWIRVFLHF